MASLRAKKAAQMAIENPKKPLGTIMREVGYSRSTSLKPENLTETKSWQELMDKYLPDELLTERHKEFLTADRIVRKYVKGELEIETEETDPSAVKALDMAYKLKKRYSDVSIGTALIVQVSPAVAQKYHIPANQMKVERVVPPEEGENMA